MPGLKPRPPKEKTFSLFSCSPVNKPGPYKFQITAPIHLQKIHLPALEARGALWLQYKYTGIPARRITKPKALFAGYLQMVVPTIAAQDNTNSAVVYGWPGAR